MRDFKLLLPLILIDFVDVAASYGNKGKTEKTSSATASVNEVSIGGMTCIECEQTI